MALPPIQVQLSKFEQIEILRQEIELREEEFKQTEKYIRTIMWEVERQKYLQSIHPLFQQLQPPAEAASLVQFAANREALQSAIDVMKAQLLALEAETRGQAAPAGLRASMPQRPGAPGAAAGAAGGIPGAPKRKFDNFDDFRTQRPGGPPKA